VAQHGSGVMTADRDGEIDVTADGVTVHRVGDRRYW
jgi:hypothetical protein